MNRYPVTKQVVQIFPAALLSQRKLWENTIPLLPAHTCLLITDTSTQKQTAVMRQIAQSFRNGGWQVLIWMTPRKTENVAYQ